MRSEAKFLNDLQALTSERDSKERIKNKEEVKEFKEDKYMK